MSIRLMSAVLDDPYFEQGDKAKLLVALILADCARSEDGKSWPSLETLARKSRTSVRGVQEACRELEKDGKIRIELNAGRCGTNAYFLLYTPAMVAPAAIAPPRNKAPEKAAEIPPEKAAADCTQNHKEPPLSGKNGKEASSAHAEFVTMWVDQYPTHHDGEAYAFQGGKDGAAVKQLLATTGRTPAELMRVAVAAWKRPADFHSKAAASLTGFNSKFNDIRNELNAQRGNGAAAQTGNREKITVPVFKAV